MAGDFRDTWLGSTLAGDPADVLDAKWKNIIPPTTVQGVPTDPLGLAAPTLLPQGTDQIPGYGDFQKLLTDKYGQQPPQLNTGQADQTRAQQQSYLQMLQDQAMGKGPSLAQGYLQQATDQSLQGAMALGQSQGLGYQAAARGIADRQAQIGQQAAGQSAQIRLQEELGARSMLGGALQGVRGQDIATAQTNLGAKLDTNALVQKYVGMGMDLATAQQRATYESARANQGATQDWQRGVRNFWGNVINTAGGVAEHAMPWNVAGKSSSFTPDTGPANSSGVYSDGSISDAPVPITESRGGDVPGQASAPGDTEANDTIPAMLSPHEIVIPRSIALHPDAPAMAAGFVEAIRSLHQQERGYGRVMEARRRMAVGGDASPLASYESGPANQLPFASVPGTSMLPPGASPLNWAPPSTAMLPAPPPQMAARPSMPSPVEQPPPSIAPPGLPSSAGFDLAIKGKRDEARIEGEKAKEEGRLAEDTLTQQKQLAERQAAMENQRREYMTGGMEKLASLSSQFQHIQTTINPDRYWANKSTGERMLAGFGVLLSGIGQGLAGGPNLALETINKAISDDIDAQKFKIDSEMRKGNQAIANQNTVLGIARQHFGDEATAIAASKSIMLDQAITKTQMLSSKYASPLLKAQTDQFVGQLQNQKAQYDAAVQQRLFENANTMLGRQIEMEKWRSSTTVPGANGPALTPEAANEARKSSAPVNEALASAKAAREFASGISGGTVPGSEANARANILHGDLTTKLKALAGVKGIGPEAQAFLEKLSTNPGSWSPNTVAKLDELISSLERTKAAGMQPYMANPQSPEAAAGGGARKLN